MAPNFKSLGQHLTSNWKAGLTVSMINIPLSISLAVASGGTPIQWIITWIWSTVFASLFASSKHNVFWVAGALASIVLSFVLANGEKGIYLIPLLSIVSWVMMLIIYFLNITKYITLIPSSVLHWFLMSVGISIALSQINWALGLNTPELNIVQHKEIYLNVRETIKHISSTNIPAFILFLLGLGTLMYSKKKFPNFPMVITVCIIGIFIGFLSEWKYLPDMLLLKDKYPTLAFAFFINPFHWLELNSLTDIINIVKPLLVTSFTIAIIAILETIISAKLAEKITKKPFDKNKEVFWLSLSNIASGFAGGMPVSAVFIRTALNIKSGGNNKMSAFLIGIFTLLISALLFNGFFKFIPFPIISAILISIALGLVDINLLKKIYRLERKAFYIVLITVFLAVFEEPIYGILAWTAISLLIFLKGVYKSKPIVNIFRDKKFFTKMTLKQYVDEQEAGDIIVMKLPWGLNYLNIENYISEIRKIREGESLVISFSRLWDIDIDGLEILEEMIEEIEAKNIKVYLSWVEWEIEETLSKLHIYHHMKKNNQIFPSTSYALEVIF
jgi:sulfate permease, SulP family